MLERLNNFIWIHKNNNSRSTNCYDTVVHMRSCAGKVTLSICLVNKSGSIPRILKCNFMNSWSYIRIKSVCSLMYVFTVVGQSCICRSHWMFGLHFLNEFEPFLFFISDLELQVFEYFTALKNCIIPYICVSDRKYTKFRNKYLDQRLIFCN